MHTLIKNWIVPISGYTQSRKQRTGLSDLSLYLHRNFCSPETWVHPVLPWNSDWQTLARFMQINSVPRPHILIAAYSWGAGWGAPQLSNSLKDLGLDVDVLVLADPVYRSEKWYMRWRSILPQQSMFAPEIEIPANVHKVKSTSQFQNTPHAHKLTAVNKKLTTLEEPHEDGALYHAQMDESEIFHHMAETAAAKMIFPHKHHDPL